MKELAEQSKKGNLNPEELEALNAKLNNLATQVRVFDEESRKTEYQGIVERALAAVIAANGARFIFFHKLVSRG
jgi:hypothetical protein